MAFLREESIEWDLKRERILRVCENPKKRVREEWFSPNERILRMEGRLSI